MRKQFDFYAYTSNTAGKYYIGGVEYFYGEDFRSARRYKEYKDTGFNMLLLQHENSYSGEKFEGSACHKCMTEAYKAGLDRIIVSDTRLKNCLWGQTENLKPKKNFFNTWMIVLVHIAINLVFAEYSFLTSRSIGSWNLTVRFVVG